MPEHDMEKLDNKHAGDAEERMMTDAMEMMNDMSSSYGGGGDDEDEDESN